MLKRTIHKEYSKVDILFTEIFKSNCYVTKVRSKQEKTTAREEGLNMRTQMQYLHH